jgi:hypothetical protein
MMSSLLPLLCTVEILSFHFNFTLRGHRGENACIKVLYDTEEKFHVSKVERKTVWIKKYLRNSPPWRLNTRFRVQKALCSKN